MALVTPCDRTNGDPATNGQLVQEVINVRKQRDDCADRMDGVAKWRSDAAARYAAATAKVTGGK